MRTSTTAFRPRNLTFVLGLGLGLGLGSLACSDDDEGNGGDGNGALSPAEQVQATRRARETARCACEDGGFETISACAARASFSLEYTACDLAAYTASGVGAEALDCFVEASREQASCYSAISGCDTTAVDACDAALDAATAACDPAFASIPGDDFFDALEACVASDVVGPAAGCAPGAARSATGEAAFEGSAIGAGDDLQPSCESVSSADVELAWTAPTAGTYRFDTDGSFGEVALFILESCDGAELACDIWAEGTDPNRSSVIELAVSEGETYIIVVDFLFESVVGNYQVNIEAL